MEKVSWTVVIKTKLLPYPAVLVHTYNKWGFKAVYKLENRELPLEAAKRKATANQGLEEEIT